MANERLRSALTRAGIDSDELAGRIGVEPKTVSRWLAGRTSPTPRHQAAVARALGRSVDDLWPDAVGEHEQEDARREIVGAWPHATDLRAIDWRVLLRGASAQVDLLSYRLTEMLHLAGIVESLTAKGASGCRVRILLPAIDSTWVALAARELQGGEEDFVGRNALEREIELAIGYLQPLLGKPGIDVRVFYGDLFPVILRFDQDLLITQRLFGGPDGQGPLLHLHRQHPDGLFAQFEAHLEALHRSALPLHPDPDLYPDPRLVPERYRAVTEKTYKSQARWVNQQVREHTPSRPLDEVRRELRDRRAEEG